MCNQKPELNQKPDKKMCIRDSIKDAEKRQILLVEHESILRAIRSRHVAEAKEAVRAHIDNQEITVSKNIKERE